MSKSWSILLMLLLVSGACEDPIEIDIPDGPERLVVEGWIYDQPGPYQIKLSVTNNFNDLSPNPKVTNAHVTVQNILGQVYEFTEQEPGIYRSSADWRGETGMSYTCNITLEDGTEVISGTEPLAQVPAIDSLFFKEVLPANIIDGIIQEEYFMGSIIQDPPGENNYYRWRIQRNGAPLLDVQSIVIFSDRFVDGNVFQLEVPQLLFARGDTVIVTQEAISEQAFDYYDLLIAQATTLGQSSGTAPAILRGNLLNINDPSAIILGYFGAVSVTSDTLIISPDN